jgi:16S rRNA C1402 N4-methylase RsmH
MIIREMLLKKWPKVAKKMSRLQVISWSTLSLRLVRKIMGDETRSLKMRKKEIKNPDYFLFTDADIEHHDQ